MKKILLLLLVCFTMQSCYYLGAAIEAPKMRREYTEKNDAIPPDFGKNNTVLILKKRGGSYNRPLKSAIKKYLGEYVYLESKENVDEKYQDKSKYRYVFDYTNGKSFSTTTKYGNLAPTTDTKTLKKFFIYDRLLDKTYQSGAEFHQFQKGLKVYFENLEIKRQSVK